MKSAITTEDIAKFAAQSDNPWSQGYYAGILHSKGLPRKGKPHWQPRNGHWYITTMPFIPGSHIWGNPTLTKKLNDGFKLVTGVEPKEIEEYLQAKCLVTEVVDTGTRRSHDYKEKLEKIECWVDGYIKGGGEKCCVLTGTIKIKQPDLFNPNNGALVPRKPKNNMIIMVVPYKEEDHNYHVFAKELTDLLSVAHIHSQ